MHARTQGHPTDKFLAMPLWIVLACMIVLMIFNIPSIIQGRIN